MKTLLNNLYNHQTLSRLEAREVLTQIAKGEFDPFQVASFLTVFNMRSITVEELAGFRDAMLALCLAIDLSEFQPIDLCGTGGDGKNTFNISTVSAFVVAGAGVKVAKHGNYGVSSVSGSSNVMQYFGYQFTNDQDVLKRQVDQAGICFLHAPLFHPAMKHVAPVRRALGVKTFFNMLGPMVNPCFPKHQLVGVFNLELARLYHYLFQTEAKRYVVIHALDGYDEVSLTGPCKVASDEGERVVGPANFGFERIDAASIYGGDSVEAAARIFMNVLKNEATSSQMKVVVANSALAIQCAKPQLDLLDAVTAAQESLLSGKALASFNRLVA